MFRFKEKPKSKCSANGHVHALLVIDVSGSMDSEDLSPNRLEAAKEASLGYVGQLRDACPEADVSVVSYGSDARVECRKLNASEHYSKIRKRIKRLKIRGCTDIGRALKVTGKILKGTDHSLVHVVLLSDGYHNGKVPPEPMADHLKSKFKAKIDCVGIGSSHSSVDEGLLKAIASLDEENQPRYHFIKDSFELLQHFKKLAGYLTTQ